METTLTEFQRNFRAAREAADRGETIHVKSGHGTYVFVRSSATPTHPFADLEHLFGVIQRPARSEAPRETIRRRLKTRRAG